MSRGVERALELTAEIMPAAAEGICRGSRGRSGKNELDAPLRALPESARATGRLLGRACERRVEIRLAAGRVVVGLTLGLEVLAVVGVDIRWGTVEDC